MRTLQQSLGLIATVGILSVGLSAGAFAYTIENGSMVQTGANVGGWDATSGETRGNGPYNGTVAYQAINSTSDTVTASGSLLFTASAAGCSLTQDTLITAAGQTVTVSADVARDAGWTKLYMGFYNYTAYDEFAGGVVDLMTVPADTDGTLNSFRTVSVTATLPEMVRWSGSSSARRSVRQATAEQAPVPSWLSITCVRAEPRQSPIGPCTDQVKHRPFVQGRARQVQASIREITAINS